MSLAPEMRVDMSLGPEMRVEALMH
jgi:hypothetical protein